MSNPAEDRVNSKPSQHNSCEHFRYHNPSLSGRSVPAGLLLGMDELDRSYNR